jgi:hypothetical protein
MVLLRAEADLIIISIGESFGKVIHFNNLDATKLPLTEHPDHTLVISPEEIEVYMTYLENVIADITPRLVGRLDLTIKDQIESIVGSEIEFTDEEEGKAVVAAFKPGVITDEGLNIIGTALEKAITEGILSQWQEGNPKYDAIQRAHSRNYEDAVTQIANAATYRTVHLKDRVRVKNRQF